MLLFCSYGTRDGFCPTGLRNFTAYPPRKYAVGPENFRAYFARKYARARRDICAYFAP
jgi:hypothetical protein